MCEWVCVYNIWGFLLYIIFCFKTMDNCISLNFKVNDFLHFMFGGFAFIWEHRWILFSPRKSASVSPWRNPSSDMRVDLFRVVSTCCPASLPPGATVWFWYWIIGQINVNKYQLQLWKIGVIQFKVSNSFNFEIEYVSTFKIPQNGKICNKLKILRGRWYTIYPKTCTILVNLYF